MPKDPKTAVILFNLGGPHSLREVRPFLRNLFSDPAILRVQPAFRRALAWFISMRRAPTAKRIYAQIGGKSPIVEQTRAQAIALEEVLRKKGEWRVFSCMRYWHPMSTDVVRQVKAYNPDRVVLLPLYPQYSTATTASSIEDWKHSALREGLKCETHTICCYPTDRRFIAAHAELLRQAYWRASEEGEPRVLFSAHGLPEKIVAAGDPYPWQVEKTVHAIVDLMAMDELDYVVCYQSRVGPLKWIEPSTEEEIERAGKDGKSVVVVPVSFVSEHSETLVELDIEYAKLAKKAGVKNYVRVPALAASPHFIEALAELCFSIGQKKKRRGPPERAACPNCADMGQEMAA
jgi:ferrochelatase